MARLPANLAQIGPSNGSTAPSAGSATGTWALGLVLIYALLVATYYVVRPGGRWAEHDTAAQAMAIRGMAETGRLAGGSAPYPSGYGYAALSNVLLALTGLSIPALQQLTYPLVSVLLVLPAWALYRELTGTWRGAALAALLLFAQPEFLFVVFRGSHERMLRAFMLIALWLLVRSFRFGDRPGRFGAHVMLFYVAAFGLVATNALFGLSFVAAITAATATAWVLAGRLPGLMPIARQAAARLTSVTFAVAGICFLFVFYAYPLALTSLQAVHEVVIALLFTTEESATATVADPYAGLVEAWTSLEVYFLVSVANYLLLVGSAAIWVWQGIVWARGKGGPATVSAGLLWLLYGAFAIQGVLAIWADRTGLLGGNLQHRSFPSFTLVAVPLVAAALMRLRMPAWGQVFAGLAVSSLVAITAIKMTLEPSVSNKWTFHTSLEMQALEWADRYSRYESIWVGPDERLRAAADLVVGISPQNNEWDIGAPESLTRLFLISDVIELQSARVHRPVPVAAQENRVYDNGATQLYRLRPRTPYQR